MGLGGSGMGWGTKARRAPVFEHAAGNHHRPARSAAACSPASTPEPGLDIPAAYDGASKIPAVAEAALPPLDWWRAFRSRELTEIVEAARASNLDIAAAVARIVQADAQARITGAALLPTVNLNASATRSRSSQTLGGTGVSAGRSERDNLQATLNASYEIDFWGKNRAPLRAAEETAVASRYDREVVGLTTVVAAANAYFQVLAAQDRLRVAHENLASANARAQSDQAAARSRHRLRSSTSPQQESRGQYADAPRSRRCEQTLQAEPHRARAADRALARTRARARRQLRGIAYPRVTPGLPSELLAQRPDIREAEANLAAANANVDNARAQFLPSITLTGEGGYQSAVLKTLFRPESVFYIARRRPDAADLRGRPAARQSRPAKGQAGRIAATPTARR